MYKITHDTPVRGVCVEVVVVGGLKTKRRRGIMKHVFVKTSYTFKEKQKRIFVCVCVEK